MSPLGDYKFQQFETLGRKIKEKKATDLKRSNVKSQKKESDLFFQPDKKSNFWVDRKVFCIILNDSGSKKRATWQVSLGSNYQMAIQKRNNM